ncbi:MAG: DNA mismatch repair endonuclease MutL [Aquificaceae bacterium]|nr:DNA mismatch repair endonuclease MutL [Aquificaceae bacterium]
MRINLLSEEVKSQIASGEVIEGPAECVKELMENALDAEAKRVEVEIIKAGKRFISVRDNGTGIPSDELPKAILSGATSKIKSIEDLQSLGTYGYRGEALHSISSVSRLVIRSRFYQEDLGREIRVEAGQVVSSKTIGMQVGTHVEVYDLFYNMPLRKSFLRKENLERRRVYGVFTALSLANPDVFLRLEAEGKEVFKLKPVSGIKERAEDVFGQRFEHIVLEEKPFRVELLLSVEGSRKGAFVFINRRPVYNRSLLEYLKKTAGSSGLCLCYIHVPPYMLDVNVHPKKAEVRLIKEGKIKNLISQAVGRRHTFTGYTLAQKVSSYTLEPEFVGIIDNTIIVARYGDYLYFFDQHLLSERYNYEMGASADRACGMSVKAGEKLDQNTARELLRKWVSFHNKEVCPHGRSIYHRIPLSELYKKLGRTY